jgi:hypothetical protein
MTVRTPNWPAQMACTVEVLVVPGCPSAQLALARVREAAEAVGIHANLRVLTVDREEIARSLGFAGSPTIRIDGVDVEDGAAGRPAGLACRIYTEDGEIHTAPPPSWIRRGLAEAVARQRQA